MYNGQTISVKRILWDVMQHPLAQELSYDLAAQYAVDALELIGAPLSYVDSVTNPPLKLVNYKAELPANLVNIRGIRLLRYDNDPTGTSGHREQYAVALRHATDIYHKVLNCNVNDEHIPEEYTYTVQNGILYTSIPEGEVEVSYKALPVDDEGYPLLPNEIKTRMAVQYYILYRYLEPLYDVGKITDKAFQRISQEKSFYMGAAQNSLQLAGIDHLESVMNAVNRLIVNDQAHENFYKELGKKERLRRYS